MVSVELEGQVAADGLGGEVEGVEVVLHASAQVLVEGVRHYWPSRDARVHLFRHESKAQRREVVVGLVEAKVVNAAAWQRVYLGFREEREVAAVEREVVPERGDGRCLAGGRPVEDDATTGACPPPRGELESWASVGAVVGGGTG